MRQKEMCKQLLGSYQNEMDESVRFYRNDLESTILNLMIITRFDNYYKNNISLLSNNNNIIIIILENRIFFPSLNSVRIPRLHLLLLE